MMETWHAKLICILATFLLPFLFTILPTKVNKEFEKRGEFGAKILSWLMCFGGGVFFATYLMDMSPGVKEILHYSLLEPNNITYPLSELLIGVGFFLVLFIEQIALTLHPANPKHKHDNVNNAQKTPQLLNGTHSIDLRLVNVESKARLLPINGTNQDASTREIENAEEHASKRQRDGEPDDKEVTFAPDMDPRGHGHGHSHGFDSSMHGSRSFLLAIALSLHRIFEGMSVGLKYTSSEVWTLFGAVMCHELVIAFSLGLQFVKNKFSLKKIIVISFVCSIVMPIGVAVGTMLTEMGGTSNGLDIANGVLQAVSSGTFIYVTFFEILQGEISHDEARIDKLVAILLGFGVLAALSAIPEPTMLAKIPHLNCLSQNVSSPPS